MKVFLNQNHPIVSLFLVSIFISSSEGCLQTVARVVQEDWQIQVGDSQTYVIREYYDFSDENPYESSSLINDEDNNSVVIVLKKGLIFRCDIIFLGPDEARGKITFNDTITSQEQPFSSPNFLGWNIVRPSIDNKTYWEDYCKYRGFENVTGDLIVSEITTEDSKVIHKWNWRTGWLNYYFVCYYVENWNETTIISAYEVSVVPMESSFPLNVLVGGFILVFIVLILLGIKKFK
ncbi:MAG: hypothetical protein ACFFDC_11495 [Promethearchaeota archaeon]